MSMFDENKFITDPEVRHYFHIPYDAVVTEDQRRECLRLLAHAWVALDRATRGGNTFLEGRDVEIINQEDGEVCVRSQKSTHSTVQLTLPWDDPPTSR